jgi:hypothetical protein
MISIKRKLIEFLNKITHCLVKSSDSLQKLFELDLVMSKAATIQAIALRL